MASLARGSTLLLSNFILAIKKKTEHKQNIEIGNEKTNWTASKFQIDIYDIIVSQDSAPNCFWSNCTKFEGDDALKSWIVLSLFILVHS